MKTLFQFVFLVSFAIHVNAQTLNGSPAERKSLEKATLAIRDAFTKGDAVLVAKLHHPDVTKYFGENNVVTGRTALEKGLTEWFHDSKIEFIENTVESTIFTGTTAIQTCIFSIKSTPKAGGNPVINRGRSMVVYVRDKTSPTGWLSIREMAQAAPAKKE